VHRAPVRNPVVVGQGEVLDAREPLSERGHLTGGAFGRHHQRGGVEDGIAERVVTVRMRVDQQVDPAARCLSYDVQKSSRARVGRAGIDGDKSRSDDEPRGIDPPGPVVLGVRPDSVGHFREIGPVSNHAGLPAPASLRTPGHGPR
jgi:hypothetical protein